MPDISHNPFDKIDTLLQFTSALASNWFSFQQTFEHLLLRKFHPNIDLLCLESYHSSGQMSTKTQLSLDATKW